MFASFAPLQLTTVRAFALIHLILIGLGVFLLSAMDYKSFDKLRFITLGAIALAGPWCYRAFFFVLRLNISSPSLHASPSLPPSCRTGSTLVCVL